MLRKVHFKLLNEFEFPAKILVNAVCINPRSAIGRPISQTKSSLVTAAIPAVKKDDPGGKFKIIVTLKMQFTQYLCYFILSKFSNIKTSMICRKI